MEIFATIGFLCIGALALFGLIILISLVVKGLD